MAVTITLLKSNKPIVWGQVDQGDLISITKDEIVSKLDKANLHNHMDGNIMNVLYHNCVISFACSDVNEYLEAEVVGNNRMSAISKLADALEMNAFSLDGNEVNESYDNELGEWVNRMMSHK